MRLTTTLPVLVIAAGLLAVTPAWAGELKIGVEPLETNDKGELTDAGRAAAVTEVEAEPGNERWTLYLYARLDKRVVEGPLYVEVYRERKGKQLPVFRKEHPSYARALYVSMDIELDAADGFHVDETVEVAFIQNVAGRTTKWAKTPLTLRASSAPPEPEDEAPVADELDGEDEDEDEDEGEGEAAAPAQPATPEPPPVTTTKRGCQVGGHEPSASLALLLVLLGLRRRQTSSSLA